MAGNPFDRFDTPPPPGNPFDRFDTQPPPANRPTSQTLGFVEGLRKPLDNAALALDAGLRRIGVPTDAISNAFGMPGAREANANAQAAFQNAEQHYAPGGIGRFVGETAATTPLLALSRNPAIVGAAQGAALTDQRTAGGVATDAAIGGGIGYGVGKATKYLAEAIAPTIRPAVRTLHEAGVKLTPGMATGGKAMVAEDRALSRPIIGDALREGREATQETFNVATVNKALAPLGIKVPDNVKAGHDAVDWAHRAVSDAYEKVVPNLAVKLDTKALTANVRTAAGALKPADQQQLQSIVKAQLGNGALSGQGLKNAQAEIRRLASLYSRAADADSRELGRVLNMVDDEVWSAILAQNSKHAPQLQAANTAFRGLAVAEDAASRADGGIFSTTQLRQAVRAADPSRRKAAVARGNAFLQSWSEAAREVIPSRAANTSGTAGAMMAGNPVSYLIGAIQAGALPVKQGLIDLAMKSRNPHAIALATAIKGAGAPAAQGAVTARDVSGR